MAKLVQLESVGTQTVIATMDERMPLFTSIDRSFVIEAALCQAIVGSEGDKIMESTILGAFPSESDLKKLDATSQELKIIKEGPVARCTGPAASQMLQAALEVVDGMLRGSSPQQKFMTSGIMMKLSPTLPLFCQATVSNKGKSSILTGAEAAKELLTQIKDRASEHAISFNDLEPLHAFQWLLDEESLDELTSLTKTLVSTVTTPTKGAEKPKTPPKGNKNPGGKSSKEDGEDMALADVMSLFT